MIYGIAAESDRRLNKVIETRGYSRASNFLEAIFRHSVALSSMLHVVC